MNNYYVYIITNQNNTVLYIGVTNNLARRVNEHFNADESKFAGKYRVYKLVWYEIFNDPYLAIKREKSLKKWNRQWKIDLIEKYNPDWEELRVYE